MKRTTEMGQAINKFVRWGIMFLVVFFLTGVAMGAPDTDHYRIVHRSFRDLVLGGNRIEINKLAQQGQDYVRAFWNRERTATDTVKASELRTITAETFGIDGKKVMVINWPAPSVSPEAFMSAVILSERPSYYCLEMLDTSNPFAKILAEGGMVVLGKWTTTLHENYGFVELPKENRAVTDMLKAKGLL